jgi:hypothetical protein
VQDGKAAAIKAVDFEADQSTGRCSESCSSTGGLSGRPWPDFESIIIAIAGNKKSSAACDRSSSRAHGTAYPRVGTAVSLRPMDRPAARHPMQICVSSLRRWTKAGPL